jgi:hypothetical protein
MNKIEKFIYLYYEELIDDCFGYWLDHVLYDFSGKGLKILQGGYVTLLVEIKLPVHHLKA